MAVAKAKGGEDQRRLVWEAEVSFYLGVEVSLVWVAVVKVFWV